MVPFNTTFTPGKELPSSADVTLPVTVRSCAKAEVTNTREAVSNSKTLLIDLVLSLDYVKLKNITKRSSAITI
ncbi:hypothetical protein SanaruYs_24670 [Chryseotalea sanaruensis]|uniref:Uncharacterized protein n=1 Tax=Chryseotalea sanaruensis TaxID=2482724 RepID=A0A401UBG8_9BACT|nr:hypothetical protein SanaruYs_24670 [Chryseotalea sanaruensis]